MRRTRKILWLVATLMYCLFQLIAYVSSEKYKICIVDGKGGFDRSGEFCPKLDKPESKVECVIAVDRLDCLRRLSKGTADFSVFTPEDLVTAASSRLEVLVTNELRYTKDKNEYEIVAIIDNKSGIKSKHDLKDKRFCHPGYGFKTDSTKILSNYLEASVIPRICDPALTITENRIKASSEFFKSACKAGSWVANPRLDRELKAKYPNLCRLCDTSSKCSSDDKYWGRRGPLQCLTDGAGDVAWARVDDVRIHFGFEPGATDSTPDNYSYLCPDNSIRPLNGSNPCIWVVKPWPVVATKRESAQEVQGLMATLGAAEGYSWKSALLSLIQTIHSTIEPVESLEAIESYLERADGFLNANSFSGCHPPRTVQICTTSVLENAKCGWLSDSAAAYGIEPDLGCLKADNTTHCMDAVANGVADLVMVPSDLVHLAESKYRLGTLFYETATDDFKYLTVAVTKSGSSIKALKDARGKKACFPNFDGVAWNSAVHSLHNQSLLNVCPFTAGMGGFFGSSCVPDLPEDAPAHLKELCLQHQYVGEFGAIQCLLNGGGDVAFLSKNSLLDFIKDPIENKYGKVQMSDFGIICESKSAGCHLSWAALGRAMVRSDTPQLWMNDTLDVFMQLDALFGKNYKTLTTPLQLFGMYDGKQNVLFHDNTARFRDAPNPKNSDRLVSRNYESVLKEIETCTSSSHIFRPATVVSFILGFLLMRAF